MEEEIKELERRLESNTRMILDNLEKIESNKYEIDNNSDRIQKNSYALDILREYKTINKRQFILSVIFASCWLITLVVMLLK